PGHERTLLAEQAEELRGRRRVQLHPAIQSDLAAADALEGEVEPGLDAGRAVRDLAEVRTPELLLFHAERAVVGGNALQIVELQAAPQVLLVARHAQRRAHHVLAAFEARLLVIAVVEEEVLRAGLGVRADAAIARLAHLLERFGRAQVHDI